jgi:DNA-3-methyladenine glycosylase I
VETAPSPPFLIRLAGSGDAATVTALAAALFEQTFGAANRPEDMRAYLAKSFNEARQRGELEDPSSRIWLAENPVGEAIGYAQLRLDAAPPAVIALAARRSAELVRLYADRGWHGGGVGASLMQTCIAAAAEAGADVLWLGVWQKNPRAIAFYEKLGFRRVGEQQFLLGADRQLDWVMALALPDSRLPVSADMERCSWPRTDLDIAYHDSEWGVPVHDDRVLFELLTLEGAQAGLSWSTILKKREGYRRAFADFDPVRVARFTASRVDRLVLDPAIVRHRQKIESTVSNAKAFLRVQKEVGSFDRYVWQFVGGEPRINRWRRHQEIPPRTTESIALSKDLTKRGFRFVGSTICYAFMQAVGMVNDHTVDCFRHVQLTGAPHD